MLRNNRFYILLGSFIFSLIVFVWVSTSFPQGTVQMVRLSQTYALTAVAFLYFALLAGPLCFIFPRLPLREQFLHARRALGVAAFYFALLHAGISFFGLLGGFEGLPFLSDRYLLNTVLGFLSLFILFLLTITSFDAAIKKLTFSKWKLLHRFVYVAGLFILIHALMLGTHFRTFSAFIPQIFFTALAVLLFLEAGRVDAYLQKKIEGLPRFGLTAAIVIGFLLTFYAVIFITPESESPLSVHNQHIQQAKEAQQDGLTANVAKLPGMDGDKSKRFTTGFIHPDMLQPGQTAELKFPVYDASSGNRVQYYKTIYEKPSHLVIVDSTLTYYSHIHPDPTEDGFIVSTDFPKAGKYHLYLNYQPLGGIEQQTAFTLRVGKEERIIASSNAIADKNLTKSFGEYNVTIKYPNPLNAKKLSVGQQLITFTITNKAGKQVTTLKPYLAAFGHLVMINKDTYEYIHVHPNNLTAPKPDENGGPDVTFMPLGLYGPIKPGIYRVFGQFNPDGKLFTADFTVEIQ